MTLKRKINAAGVVIKMEKLAARIAKKAGELNRMGEQMNSLRDELARHLMDEVKQEVIGPDQPAVRVDVNADIRDRRVAGKAEGIRVGDYDPETDSPSQPSRSRIGAPSDVRHPISAHNQPTARMPSCVGNQGRADKPLISGLPARSCTGGPQINSGAFRQRCDIARPRKRRQKRLQEPACRSIADDAFLMAAVNKVDSLTRDNCSRARMTSEQKEIAAEVLARTERPVMAISARTASLMSWREERNN